MSELHERIKKQYASDRGCAFYKAVMGDGGFDIHYGIYAGGKTSMKEATRASTQQLLAMACDSTSSWSPNAVIDFGSGRGGSAHELAHQQGAKVVCVDLCEKHHQENRLRAEDLGIDHLISTWTGTYEVLPRDWSGIFDLAWSQETLCHATSLSAVIAEAFRVIRPGGVFAFSDLMLSDSATEEQAAVFSGVNAIARLSTLARYKDELQKAGFTMMNVQDWSHHLHENFVRMLGKIETKSDQLLAMGVDRGYLETFADSLRQRMAWSPGSVLQWGAAVAIRPSVQ